METAQIPMDAIWNIFVAIWIGVCVISWVIQYKLYKLVKETNYEKWVWLGKPEIPFIFTNNNVNQSNPFVAIADMYRITFRIFAFGLKEDKQLTEDSRIKKIWILHHIVSLISLLLFFGFFVFVAVAMFVFHVN